MMAAILNSAMLDSDTLNKKNLDSSVLHKTLTMAAILNSTLIQTGHSLLTQTFYDVTILKLTHTCQDLVFQPIWTKKISLIHSDSTW